MKLYKKKYSNGLKLVYQNISFSNTTTINIFVKVGSINEDINTHGFSHFLEHMLFKGSKKYPNSNIISKHFDSIGAYFNAYTDYDHTCYVVKCDSDYFEKSLDILSDMLLNSLLSKKEFEIEKTVVVDEIIRAKDNVEGYINEKIYELLFNGSSFENPIGGNESQILKYNRLSGKKYYKSFYKPSNMVLSIASNLGFNKIIEFLETNQLTFNSNVYTKIGKFNDSYIPIDTYKPNYIIKNLPLKISRLNLISKNDLEQIYISVGFLVEGRHSNDYYILLILKIILAGNMSSLLFSNLREKKGLTYNVSIDLNCFDKFGAFVILTSVDKDKFLVHQDKKGVLPIIIDTLNYIKMNKITLEELNIAKGFLKGHMSLQQDDSLNITEYNGKNTLFQTLDQNISYNQIYKQRYSNISLVDINRIIDKYIKIENLFSCYIGENINKDTQLISKIIETENTLQ